MIVRVYENNMRIKRKKLKKPRLKKKVRRLKKTLKKFRIESSTYKTKIKVIGIGGGGSSIVSGIASEIKKVAFVVANTDSQALKTAAKEARHFQFGKNITQGLGTGMNPELGEQAARSDKEKIKELLKETDFCILVSCLGGGTGSGASPVFANILKNLGILTLGIFTLPFEFEGEVRAQIAKDSLEKLRQNLNALVIIPNQKIFQIINKNTPLKEAFSTVNKALIENLGDLITLLHSPGLIHVDFANLKTILAGRGRLAYLNTIDAPIPSNFDQATEQAKNPNQIDPHTKPSYGVGVEELTKGILSNPLIPYSFQGAKEILFNIDGGLNLNISQVEQIGKIISSPINARARVAFGITSTPTPKFGVGTNKKKGIKITLLASGCQWKWWEKEKQRPKKEATTHFHPALSWKGRGKPKVWTPKPPELLKVQQPEVSRILPEEAKKVKIQVRKNALEIKKSIEKEEKKILDEERKWETPAFLRQTGQVDESPKE